MVFPSTPNPKEQASKLQHPLVVLAFLYLLFLGVAYLLKSDKAFEPRELLSTAAVAGSVYFVQQSRWALWKRLSLCVIVSVVAALIGVLIFE